jgi:hypothetical protein
MDPALERLTVEFGRLTDTVWLQCLNPRRLSQTRIQCTAPPGTGQSLYIRITIFNQTLVSGNPYISYTPPIITRVCSSIAVPWY